MTPPRRVIPPGRRKKPIRVIQPGETQYHLILDEADVIALASGTVCERIQQRLRRLLPERITTLRAEAHRGADTC